MRKVRTRLYRYLLPAVLSLGLAACGGSGGGGSNGLATGTASPPAAPGSAPQPTTPPLPEPATATPQEAARFLSQATFGPTAGAIETVVDSSLEHWFMQQLAAPPSLHLEGVLARFPPDGRFLDERGNLLPGLVYTASDSFWRTAIEADDQLRQRMAYTLSQILVIAAQGDLSRAPQTVAAYMDILTEGAFGNFRDLIDKVTYSPAMAVYLTYLRNEKADELTGRVPDENYARELMQLFTIGLVELDPDGEPVTGADGQAVELFNNTDITNLARVFTGLSFSGAGFNTPLLRLPPEVFHQPLQMFNAYHSMEEKAFLGSAIPADTGGRDSIDRALDIIFQHPNVGPFLARQLIQRFVTSDPAPEYIRRVTDAFNTGLYSLPSGTQVGAGNRGDLTATLAATLFDPQARAAESVTDPKFGKLREPVIRFTHWARAFEVNSADAGNERLLRDTSSPESLGQHPYRSPSVFNFYRPGYVAPGTETGAAQLTAPELQITNATSIMGYTNFLTIYALGRSPKVDSSLAPAFVADYADELELSADPPALLDHLDLLLTHGTLQEETRNRITTAMDKISPDSQAGLVARVQLAFIMIMTSPEYIVLR